MRPITMTVFALPRHAAILLALLLAACGGASDEPRSVASPPPVAADSMSGTVETGAAGARGMPLVKGNGRRRVAAGDLATGAYTATLQLLAPPYMLEASAGDDGLLMQNLHAVSTRGGNVNVTPLTALVSAYAVGQAPGDFFAALGETGGPEIAAINDASIGHGERRARSFLAGWGLTVPAGITSFVHDTFRPVAGDAMHDLIVAFRAQLLARNLTLTDVVEDIGRQQALCRVERVSVVAGGREDEFCPSSRSTRRDSGVDVYAFTAAGNDVLTVRVAADGSIASAELNGALAYACSGTACAGISLGAPDADGRRRMAFAGAVLAAAAAGAPAATLEGALLADALGRPSPQTLDCIGPDGTFHVLLTEDNSFNGNCVFGGNARASGTRTIRTFSNVQDGQNVVIDGRPMQLRIATAGETGTLSVILYSHVGDMVLVPRAEFKCGGAGYPACSGVSFGAALTEPPADIGKRPVALADTVLARVGPDGLPVAGNTATVRSERLLSALRSDVFVADCQFLPEQVNMSVAGEGAFPYCPDEANGDSFGQFVGDEIQFTGFSGSGVLMVATPADAPLVPIRVEAGRGLDLFVCDQPACLAGVSMTQDADGRITIGFSNVALQERELINTLGDRSATLTDGSMSFSPFF